jgi:hypothetical protein
VIVTKDGTTQLGGQRFRCTQCGRRFTRRSTSAFSGRAFPDDIIALGVRWYVRYRLSYAEVSTDLRGHGRRPRLMDCPLIVFISAVAAAEAYRSEGLKWNSVFQRVVALRA